MRRKLRLIEGYAKCRHLKKITCKGTLRRGRCLFVWGSEPHTLQTVYVYGEGELNQREGEGQ